MELWGWTLAGILLAAELGGVAYRRRNRYPRFGFNAWAPAIYAALLTVDCLIGAALVAASGRLQRGSRRATDRTAHRRRDRGAGE